MVVVVITRALESYIALEYIEPPTPRPPNIVAAPVLVDTDDAVLLTWIPFLTIKLLLIAI